MCNGLLCVALQPRHAPRHPQVDCGRGILPEHRVHQRHRLRNRHLREHRRERREHAVEHGQEQPRDSRAGSSTLQRRVQVLEAELTVAHVAEEREKSQHLFRHAAQSAVDGTEPELQPPDGVVVVQVVRRLAPLPQTLSCLGRCHALRKALRVSCRQRRLGKGPVDLFRQRLNVHVAAAQPDACPHVRQHAVLRQQQDATQQLGLGCDDPAAQFSIRERLCLVDKRLQRSGGRFGRCDLVGDGKGAGDAAAGLLHVTRREGHAGAEEGDGGVGERGKRVDGCPLGEQGLGVAVVVGHEELDAPHQLRVAFHLLPQRRRARLRNHGGVEGDGGLILQVFLQVKDKREGRLVVGDRCHHLRELLVAGHHLAVAHDDAHLRLDAGPLCGTALLDGVDHHRVAVARPADATVYLCHRHLQHPLVVACRVKLAQQVVVVRISLGQTRAGVHCDHGVFRSLFNEVQIL
eukprot:Rhum_TRINITY_DN18932_c0_g1::Rhum_TRINITY_DN18932_c0_g1_i1::g.168723::m.168723